MARAICPAVEERATTLAKGPTCQVCGKIGHDVLCCYHRFDLSYQVEDNRFGGTAAGATGYNVDRNWYAVIGATDLLTSDLDRLTMHERYKGADQDQVANGAGLSISHIGPSTIFGSHRPLVLNKYSSFSSY